MMMNSFEDRLQMLQTEHEALIKKPNQSILPGNGIYVKYKNPVITAMHTPLEWRYDLNKKTNPYLMERMGINSTFNAGAIKLNGKYCLVVRVEGTDRKSFFALAESNNGIDNFEFTGIPILLPQNEEEDVNVYDMRLTQHEDGWIYGIFCTERRDPEAPKGDTTAAIATAGMVRTQDLLHWERLPDIITKAPQQRNVVLHPEFEDGRYMFYTRPQDNFVEPCSGGGIYAGFADNLGIPVIGGEKLLDERLYHTIKELKNGAGAPPIKTKDGWLHLAHGVRNTASGLRYVIYAFMTSLKNPSKVIYRPGGYLIAPEGEERVGDVGNVVFTNGAIADEDGRLLIYYGSSDTRLHVAETTLDRMVDYCKNTPEDSLTSYGQVQKRLELIRRNDKLQS